MELIPDFIPVLGYLTAVNMVDY
ncbi:MAG: DUF1232 domain-containing protein [Lachnospiraceae bacterium]|nr:DUF1232 domain-containing protein [Lachnospiraceae bacterium]MBP3507598.1 DUF1232 domain-containing protein [Lachnospiraceae bacterium]